MKNPENWKIIENLASLLHAATACSKPVSDMGWRPHHEHVGQIVDQQRVGPMSFNVDGMGIDSTHVFDRGQ